MSKGSIKFFNEDKGYGFLVDDETKEDYFFHSSQLEDFFIASDDKVEFTIEKSKNRPGSLCAENIRKIENEKD